MFQINIFGREGCAKCESTRRKMEHFIAKWQLADKTSVTFYDINTVDGMAEGAFNNVSGIPTTIVMASGRMMGRWDEAIPPSEELHKLIVEAKA